MLARAVQGRGCCRVRYPKLTECMRFVSETAASLAHSVLKQEPKCPLRNLVEIQLLLVLGLEASCH